MELVHRLGSKIDDTYIDKYIEQILHNSGSCDVIWFSTCYGFPPISKHEKTAQIMFSAAKKFRESGIRVELQLSNTIGHGEYMSSEDCSGLVYEGSPVEKMVGHDGTIAEHCFCWRGEILTQYIKDELKCYLKIQPDCVWIDDDFRAFSHMPVLYGCFCDNCISAFNKKYNTDFTREKLVDEVLYRSSEARRQYIEFTREGLAMLMREISKTIHSCCPNTAIGIQQTPFPAMTGIDTDFLFDVIYEETGILPKVRPGDGCYDDHIPNNILDKAVRIEYQNVHAPSYIKYICGEIENLPFSVFGKSPSGTAFETSCYLAYGCTDMSYSMMMEINEDMSYYAKIFDVFSKCHKYWEKVSEGNKRSVASGFRYYLPENYILKPLEEGKEFGDLNPNYNGADLLRRDAIAVTFFKNSDCAILLHPDIAKIISDEEVRCLMELPVITDGETIDILKKRGFEFDISITSIPEKDIVRLYEKLMPHKTKPANFDIWKSNFFTKGRMETYSLSAEGKETEVLGVYANSGEVSPYFNNDAAPYGIAETVIKTSLGGKWAILGYQPWKGIINSYKREQLLNIGEYITDKKFGVRLLTAFPVVLLPREDEDGKTVMVSLINVTVGESDYLELFVKKPYGDKFILMQQNGEEEIIKSRKTEGGYILTIPKIKPWSVVTLFSNK